MVFNSANNDYTQYSNNDIIANVSDIDFEISIDNTIAKNVERQQEDEKKLIKIEADVAHIRERLDNGMSITINDVKKDLQTLNQLIASKIMPAIEDSQFWVGAIKKVLIAVIFIGIARLIWEKLTHLIQL